MAYKDGYNRSKGNTKWLAFIDIDEFILPKNNRTILDCLNDYYPAASGVYMCWRNFGTGGIYINPGEPIINRLTISSLWTHPRNAAGKSIVKVDDVLIDEVWSPHQLVLRDGAQYYDGSGKQLFFRGNDLQVNPQHTSDFIQVNHYAMRDENFYQKVRLPKALSREYGELSLLREHYDSFNKELNLQMIEFLRKEPPSMYQTYWRGSLN